MATPLPACPDLDQLRRRARELQRSVRAGDPAALRTAGLAVADSEWPLAEAQRALARRHGFASWARLKHHVEQLRARTWTPAPAPSDEPDADRFVRLACVTYSAADASAPAAAWRLYAVHDGLTRGHLAAAAAAADIDSVRAELAAGVAADAPCGPFGWPPLMYLSYSRLDGGELHTVEAARLLLDAGADPNGGRYFAGLPTPFTVLTGAFGGGERDEPPHPHGLALARLLLDRGADPNDAQTLYNRQFGTSDDFLEVLFEYGLATGDGGPWRGRLPELTPAPQELVRTLLAWAVTHDQRARVELLAAQGVDVRSPLPAGATGSGRTPLQVALDNGHTELAELLRRLGAVEPSRDPVDVYIGAALAGDLASTAATPPATVSAARARRPGLLVWASAQSAPAAVQLLLDDGFDIDALARGDVPLEQPWQTALHSAVERDAPEIVELLLAHGADSSICDTRFDSTPLEWAQHLGRSRVVGLLAPG